MTLLKQSSATKIGCVPLFYREIKSNAFLLCSKPADKSQEEGDVLCDMQKNTIRIFKWISSLQKCFLELSPRDIYTLTLDARNGYPLGGNIQKVFRVFKVTWYCCSTNELSWGKGCHHGFSHRSYIEIRKDYWLKVKNIKTQEKWARPRLFYSFCAIIYQTYTHLFSHLESAAMFRERFSSFPAGSVRLKITP